MASERDNASRFQFSLRSLLGFLTLAGVSFATLQLGWVSILLIPAFVAFALAIINKAKAALGMLIIMLAVLMGIVGAIVVG